MKRGNNGGYANAWLLGDVNKNEIACLELGLKHVNFEKKRDGFFASSNVAEDLKILRFGDRRRGHQHSFVGSGSAVALEGADATT